MRGLLTGVSEDTDSGSFLWKMQKGKIITDICQYRCSLSTGVKAWRLHGHLSQHEARGSKQFPMPPCLCISTVLLCCPPRLPKSNCFLLVTFLPRLSADTDLNYNVLLLLGGHGKISVLFKITLGVLKSKCWLLSSKALKNMLSVKSGNSLTYCIKAVLYLNISRCLRAICVRHKATSHGG